MKNKMIVLAAAGMLTLTGLAYGLTASSNNSCPLEGTPDCPKIDCPLVGTPECPYENATTVELPTCCKKK
ncbi:hypothetical protein [Flagellimonas sp.]|uniref:hypothetical protein n=1 Tax=Flagellimonas sp. TaxID=2058762 RepID=UPI003BAFC237